MAHIAVWVMGGMRPIHLTGVRWPTTYTTLEGDIWLVQTDGTGAHKLGSAGAKAESPAWSPDGGVIRFSATIGFGRYRRTDRIFIRCSPGWHTSGTAMLRPLDP